MDLKEELVMKMLHYFITERNYNPIILHGAKNEIWLENLDENYRVVRIVSNHIHNNDQLDFDLFKTKRIGSQIKNKTLTFNLNILNIYTDLGDNVSLDNIKSNMKCININEMTDFKKYKDILEIYPKIDMPSNDEEGMELFIKLTNDINEKTEKNAIESEKIFSMKYPIVTYALICINILIFLLMYIFGKGSTDINTLVNFGANNVMLIKDGQFFRLFTSMFLHIGIFHLFCNMYALYIIGPQLESFYGKAKYLIIYIVGGIIGSLFACIFSSSNTLAAGASGAIFALFGSLLYFGYHYRVYLGSVIRTQILPVIFLNLLIGFMYSGISNASHIGGLIGGILISMAVGVPNKTSKIEKINAWIVTILLIIFMIYMITK